MDRMAVKTKLALVLSNLNCLKGAKLDPVVDAIMANPQALAEMARLDPNDDAHLRSFAAQYRAMARATGRQVLRRTPIGRRIAAHGGKI